MVYGGYNRAVRRLALLSVLVVLLLLACEEAVAPAPTPSPSPPQATTPAAYSPRWSVQVVQEGDEFRILASDGGQGLTLATYALPPEESGERWELEASVDLDGDGQEEAIVLHYTGGAHCCFQYHVLDSTPAGIVVVQAFSLGNASLGPLEDVTGDGVPEALAHDDRLAYFDDLPYAASPFLPLVLCWRGGAFEDCTEEFPPLLRTRAQQALDQLSRGGGAKPDLEQLGTALEVAALYARLGQLEEGLAQVAEACPACARWLEGYRQELLEALAQPIPYPAP